MPATLNFHILQSSASFPTLDYSLNTIHSIAGTEFFVEFKLLMHFTSDLILHERLSLEGITIFNVIEAISGILLNPAKQTHARETAMNTLLIFEPDN
jgi:hypothetical protein